MYSIFHLCKAFFPNCEIKQKIIKKKQVSMLQLRLESGACFSVNFEKEKQNSKQEMTRQVYYFLVRETKKTLPWGMLTGVRPSKLAFREIEQGKETSEVVCYLKETYEISQEKAKLAVEIAQREQILLQPVNQQDGFSLYVGIPFCPGICYYCSFSSGDIRHWQNRVDAYVDALCKELAAIGAFTKGKMLQTIYIGGGTPTTLTTEQLEQVLSTIANHFSMEHLLEYTVEAGRADTITWEKLKLLRSFDISRISINPQTMQDKTLKRIGRRHSVLQVKTSFSLARECGFHQINMDVIVGLPGEEREDVQDTLAQIIALDPDSLTVHALAMKRGARYAWERPEVVEQGKVYAQMMDLARQGADKMEMFPYYLYRQKNIAGNFENVGYAKVDKAGIYNILIMEEKQSIWAAGAGAVSKMLVSSQAKKIRRMENVKDIAAYIDRVDEMIVRKGEEKWL